MNSSQCSCVFRSIWTTSADTTVSWSRWISRAHSKQYDSRSTAGWRIKLKVVSLEINDVFPSLWNSTTHPCPWNPLGKIKDLLAKGVLDRSTKLVLVNAIYFKGTWEKIFEESNTSDAEFRINKVPPPIGEVTSARLSLQSSWSVSILCILYIWYSSKLQFKSRWSMMLTCVCVSSLENDKKQVKMMFQEATFPLTFIPQVNCQVRPIMSRQKLAESWFRKKK